MSLVKLFIEILVPQKRIVTLYYIIGRDYNKIKKSF